eukprot:181260_1
MSINKETVFEIHEQQLMNGEDNVDNTSNLVHILGGIDCILRDYLTKPNLILSTQQLHHITQTLTTPNEYQQQHKPTSLTMVTDVTHTTQHNNSNPPPIEHTHLHHMYTFDVNNTFLHLLCGQTTAKRIKKALRNIYIQTAICLNLLIYFALDFIFPGFIAPIFGIAVTCGLWIPYGICWVLSSNRKAFYLILKSFEFWYKSVYSVIFGVLIVIYLWRLNASRGALSSKLYLALNALIRLIWVPILTVGVSTFDAVKVSKKWKCMFSICIALISTFDAVVYQFVENTDDDYVIDIESTGHSVSFQSMLASASRGLSIFFWKQAIFVLLRTRKAITIHNTPVIQWIDTLCESDDDKNQNRKETAIRNDIDLSTMNTTAEIDIEVSILNNDEDSSGSTSRASTIESKSKEKIDRNLMRVL